MSVISSYNNTHPTQCLDFSREEVLGTWEGGELRGLSDLRFLEINWTFPIKDVNGQKFPFQILIRNAPISSRKILLILRGVPIVSIAIKRNTCRIHISFNVSIELSGNKA